MYRLIICVRVCSASGVSNSCINTNDMYSYANILSRSLAKIMCEHKWIFLVIWLLTVRLGRAMAQAVSRRPPTADARVPSLVSPCGICGGQSGTGTGFSPSTSVFPCQFNSTGAPLLGKMKTDHLSLHLHHRVVQ
jgi:hypothetical protein